MSSSLFMSVGVSAGNSIQVACDEAIVLANKLGINVEFMFNGIKCIACPGGSPSVLAANWEYELESRHKYKIAGCWVKRAAK